MHLRNIDSGDWASILLIQEECYPEIEPESLGVLQSKWLLSPQSCFVVETGKQVVGYCLAHPWILGSPPSLEQVISQVEKADTLYLHDIALSAHAQGKGAGRAAVEKLLTFARQWEFDSISLVAVQGASSYWKKLGFVQEPIDKSLNTYTADACYMVFKV
ncbi:GNAT family N-acetyltransferase [Shewanella violacea]|nr:GNAT family N-acetyltransferase [Shewanella violacea]